MKILVIEDEALILAFLERGLTAEGHAVDTAMRGEEGLDRLREGRPDIVVLDIMLPGIDGFDVLAAIRAIDSELPVILLTARGEVADRVRGLDLGATDYLVKPFAFAELAARVRAHTRRPSDQRRGAASIDVGPLSLDLLAREAEVDGARVALSAREFALLAYLMRHPGQVLSRQQILDGVWGYDWFGDARTVDVHIAQVRKKIGDAVEIKTVRGVGYRLESGR